MNKSDLKKEGWVDTHQMFADLYIRKKGTTLRLYNLLAGDLKIYHEFDPKPLSKTLEPGKDSETK